MRVVSALAGGAVALAALAVAVPAVADPATVVSYPAGASATRYSGMAFDTCTAPPLAAIQAWGASPYRAVGIYIGGVNRTCGQPQLSASWVTAVSKLKWRLLPIYKGPQPACGGKATDRKIIPAQAASQGTAAADDAIAKATALGMRPGSAFYNDIENYPRTATACRTAVLTYLSAWTRELHRLGYVAGVYANLSSGALDLSGTYASASSARPDALWIARYDGSPSLTGWAGVPNGQWAVHQRAKQYRGTHNEAYGGVTISIDSDNLDAPAATVAYGYQVISTSTLNARTGPSTSYPVAATLPSGALAWVTCQAPGSLMHTTKVWDKLTDGRWATDYYVATHSKTTYTPPMPRC